MNSRPFQKSYYLKINDPSTQSALGLRFNFLFSSNGFKRIAETWAILFQRLSNQEIKKTEIKRTHDFNLDLNHSGSDASLSSENSKEREILLFENVKIGDCLLTETTTQGLILSKGHQFQWNFSIKNGLPKKFSAFPDFFIKTGIVKNTFFTPHEDLLLSGTLQVNDQKPILWTAAQGMLGVQWGAKYPSSWIWSHCNLFLDENGNPATFLFEGFSTRTYLGPLVGPAICSFFFHYRNQDYYFNHVREVVSLKSKNTLNEWRFRADRGELSFHGHVQAEHKDFAGLTYEDTDGSLLYSTHSIFSTAEIYVYRSGKLEATFTSNGAAAFEIVSRKKNPYVDFLI